MKKLLKIILIVGILAFFFLYFSYKNGYYITRNRENSILTEEKIIEYEEDLKKGIDVSKKSYITIYDNYDNAYTRFILKVSHKIEKSFDSAIKFIFKRISKRINE